MARDFMTVFVDIQKSHQVVMDHTNLSLKKTKSLNFRETKNPANAGFLWAHLGSNQGPPDYESGALTN